MPTPGLRSGLLELGSLTGTSVDPQKQLRVELQSCPSLHLESMSPGGQESVRSMEGAHMQQVEAWPWVE